MANNDILSINIDSKSALEQLAKLDEAFKKFNERGGLGNKADLKTFDQMKTYFNFLQSALGNLGVKSATFRKEVDSIKNSINGIQGSKLRFNEFDVLLGKLKQLSDRAKFKVLDPKAIQEIDVLGKAIDQFKTKYAKDKAFSQIFNATGIEKQINDLNIYANKSAKAQNFEKAQKAFDKAFNKANKSLLDPAQVKEIESLTKEFGKFKGMNVINNPERALASLRTMFDMLTRIRTLSADNVEAAKLAPENLRRQLEQIFTNINGSRKKGDAIQKDNTKLNEYSSRKNVFNPEMSLPELKTVADLVNAKQAHKQAVLNAANQVKTETVTAKVVDKEVNDAKKERAKAEREATLQAKALIQQEKLNAQERIAQLKAQAQIEVAAARERAAAIRLETARLRQSKKASDIQAATPAQTPALNASPKKEDQDYFTYINQRWGQLFTSLNQKLAVASNNFKNMSGQAQIVNTVFSYGGAAANTMSAAISAMANGSISKVNQGLQQIKDNMGQVSANSQNFMSGLSIAVTGVTALITAFKTLNDTFKEAQVEYDQARSLLFVANDGNVENAKRDLNIIRGMSNEIGVPMNAIITNYAKIKTAAMATGGVSEQEVTKVVASFAKAGKASGLGKEQFGRMFKAVEQMFSKTKISAEELKNQLGDSGLLGVQTSLAKALYPTENTATAMQKLQKAMQAGTVSSTALVGMAENMDKFSEKAMAFNADTLNNQLIALENKVVQTKQFVLENSDYSQNSVQAIDTLTKGLENPVITDFLIKVADTISRMKIGFAEAVVSMIEWAAKANESISEFMGSPLMTNLIAGFKYAANQLEYWFSLALVPINRQVLAIRAAIASVRKDATELKNIEAENAKNEAYGANAKAKADQTFAQIKAKIEQENRIDATGRARDKAQREAAIAKAKADYEKAKNDQKNAPAFTPARGFTQGENKGKGNKGLDSALREYNNAVLNADKKLNDELRNNNVEQLKQRYEDGLISKQQLIDGELKIRQEGVDEEIKLIKTRLDEANQAYAKAIAAKSEKDRLKAAGDIYSLNKDIDILMLKKGTLEFKAKVDTSQFKKEIDKTIADANAQLLELQGNFLGAALAKNKLELEQQLKSPAARESQQLANTYRQIAALKEVKIAYDEVLRVADLKANEFDRLGKVVDLTLELGMVKDQDAAKEKTRILQAQIAYFEAQIQKLEAINNLTDEQKAKIADYKIKVLELKVAANEFYSSISSAISKGMLDSIKGMIDGSNKVHGIWNKIGNIMGSIANNVLDIMIKKLSTRIENNIFGFLTGQSSGGTNYLTKFFGDIAGYFGSSPTMKLAEGGLVFGAGTSTSDSIRANLSNGEGVLNARAIQGIGTKNFEYINSTGRLPLNAVQSTSPQVINNITPQINLVTGDIARALRADKAYNDHIVKVAMANRNKITKGV